LLVLTSQLLHQLAVVVVDNTQFTTLKTVVLVVLAQDL
jgi:hypothetical protein